SAASPNSTLEGSPRSPDTLFRDPPDCGDFTRTFLSREAAALSPDNSAQHSPAESKRNPAPPAGEYTGIFAAPAVSPQLPNTGYPGEATQAFRNPTPSQVGSPTEVPYPDSAESSPGGLTYSSPHPESKLPQSQASRVPPATLQPLNLVLTAILCLLSFLLGGA